MICSRARPGRARSGRAARRVPPCLNASVDGADCAAGAAAGLGRHRRQHEQPRRQAAQGRVNFIVMETSVAGGIVVGESRGWAGAGARPGSDDGRVAGSVLAAAVLAMMVAVVIPQCSLSIVEHELLRVRCASRGRRAARRRSGRGVRQAPVVLDGLARRLTTAGSSVSIASSRRSSKFRARC